MSIIIPVYNAETYLPACLKSIINQTQKSLEIIMVDDGSTDNSTAIIKQYADIDNRIVTIRKENGGVSSARNAGIQAAKGIYTWFVDADDWVESDSVDLLKTVAGEWAYDTILFSFNYVNFDGSLIERTSPAFVNRYIFDKNNRDEVLINLVKGRLCTVWRSIYRTDFIKKHQLYFDETLRNSEDLLYSYKFLVSCENGMYVDNCLYYHRKTPNSLTHSFHRDEFTNTFRVQKTMWDGLETFMPDNKQFTELRIVRWTLNYILRLFYEYGKVDEKERYTSLMNILDDDYFQEVAWKVRYKELGWVYKVQLWLAKRKMARTIWFLNTVIYSNWMRKFRRTVFLRWVKPIYEK